MTHRSVFLNPRIVWRLAIALVLPVFALLLHVGGVAAQPTDLNVKGSGRLFPIALPRLCLSGGGGAGAEREIPEVISRNLSLSGIFEVVNPNAYIEDGARCTVTDGFAYSDWTVIGADSLVKGEVSERGGAIVISLYLHDTVRQRIALAKEYTVDPRDKARLIRKVGHAFANEIMAIYTGSKGPFGTQIVFSGKVGRFKELFVMDMDGSGLRQLTNDKGLAVSAAWRPDGNEVAFISYRRRMPDIFTLNLSTRSVRQVTFDPLLELGPEYDPGASGGAIIASRSEGGMSGILRFALDGRVRDVITKNRFGIDVSPSLSPSGDRIAFCSNRAGGPQIYTMNRDGSGVKRISFVTSNYCTSPAWSPNGEKIAFVCRADGGFQLFVANADGSNPLQLTSAGNNEDPTWSPDSRFLAFGTTFGGGFTSSIGLILADGSGFTRLTDGRGGDSQPAWGPWKD